MKIVLASKNKGKISEVKYIMGNGFEILSLLDINWVSDIKETGSTFEENAKIKAEAAFNHSGIPSIGDDSGLEVFQLNSEPGVFSARYAGKYASDFNNNIKLLFALEKEPEPHHAQFVCTALYFDGKNYLKTIGELRGTIIKEPRGENGFGYDPLFVPDGFTNTLAELGSEEKNKISHRAIAFKRLKEILSEQMEKK